MSADVTLIAGWLTERSKAGDRIWTIPPVVGFVDSLVDGLLAETGGDPLALADITVLLPTRRATRSLREAFLRRSGGKPLLLPRLMPLQDIDEDEALLSGSSSEPSPSLDIPPAIAPVSRQILLARLIMERPGPDGRKPGPDQAIRLAQELARFLDQVQTERLSFDGLADLVPETLAAHWQTTLSFLRVVTEHWPGILAGRGVVDPIDHRNQVFTAQIKAWSTQPPEGLVIAAGSTGSVPATRDLLALIASMNKGCIVLPSLDTDMDEAGWTVAPESHPQHALKVLTNHLGVDRNAVHQWPFAQTYESGRQRQKLIREIMRPADTSDQWRRLDDLEPSALAGIQRIEAPTQREEAAAIALLLRSVAEEDGKTAALVTLDRALAQRVSAELERWDLKVNDSAGRPLAQSPAGVFLQLTAAMMAEDCAPISLLSALKHPLAACGMDAAAFRDRVRDLERAVLRGPRPPPGIDGIRQRLTGGGDHDPSLLAWLETLPAMMAPMADVMAAPSGPLLDLLNRHLTLAEAMAETHDTAGPLRLWAGDDGEALARFVAELANAAADMGDIDPSAYPGLLDAFLNGQVSRPPYGTHPRLSILGPLEARLLHPDVVILAGLNEGSWPAESAADPWMSRPMRKAFGLPQPERRIGQAAHDVAQALGAPEVILTRSVKVDGTPTVPSRWWRRFDQVVDAAKIPTHTETGRYTWLPWAEALHKPERVEPQPAPAPAPPVSARPRRLSVTEIETWMRDPYEIYARHVLNLRALDPIDANASRADYGTIIHDILQTFVDRFPHALPTDAETALRRIAEDRFARTDLAPGIQAFWQPRFERIAAWFIDAEKDRRGRLRSVQAEVRGALTLDGPAGPFTLIAKADRIETETGGSLVIVDYKTGSVPSAKEVAAGYAPQLPLEAVIAASGGFTGITAAPVSDLLYWRLTGRNTGGQSVPAGSETETLRAQALNGLQHLINTFDDPSTPYEARPHPHMAPAYGDTQHLARVKEWAEAQDDGP